MCHHLQSGIFWLQVQRLFEGDAVVGASEVMCHARIRLSSEHLSWALGWSKSILIRGPFKIATFCVFGPGESSIAFSTADQLNRNGRGGVIEQSWGHLLTPHLS